MAVNMHFRQNTLCIFHEWPCIFVISQKYKRQYAIRAFCSYFSQEVPINLIISPNLYCLGEIHPYKLP